jgi:hypothetical protein
MAYENVEKYLKKCGISERISILNMLGATIDTEAEALNVKPDENAKTMGLFNELSNSTLS